MILRKNLDSMFLDFYLFIHIFLHFYLFIYLFIYILFYSCGKHSVEMTFSDNRNTINNLLDVK